MIRFQSDQNHPAMNMNCHKFKIRIPVPQILFAPAIFVLLLATLVGCQYDSGYHMANGQHGPSYSGMGGYGDEHPGGGGGDDRPKVQLGIRLKIPAFKFELPRFNLPKVTISAKIRQPDKPRTITLPEINLDTSSRVAPPSMKMGNGNQGYGMSGGGYGAGSSHHGYSAPSYGGYEDSGSISLSASSDDSSPYGNNGNNYQAQSYRQSEQPYYRQQQHHHHHHQQQQHYRGPSYQMAASSNVVQHKDERHFVGRNPDMGFNAPVYKWDARNAGLNPA